MADIDAPFRSVPFQVVEPDRIPTKRYYDEEFYKLESERVWQHAWQVACRLEQIPQVGDWIEYTILGKSVIIVRTKDGVKALHNACRHRGVALAAQGGHGNCKGQGFICPFHGWRWNMDGDNTFVYGRHLFTERQLDSEDLKLPQARVETWMGMVFINFDENAGPLRDYVGPLADKLDKYNLDKLHAEWNYATVLPANWKTAMEAFMEGYHVMRTHPQLHAMLGVLYNTLYATDPGGIDFYNPNLSIPENIEANIGHMRLLSEGMAGMCHAKDVATAEGLRDVPLPEDPKMAMLTWYGMLAYEVGRQGRERGEATPDLAALMQTDPINAVEFIFPNYFLLPFLSSYAAYRIRPLGPESCYFELWSLTMFPEGQEPKPVMEPIMLPYDSQEFPPIPRQDYENIPRQQIGLHAEGFDYMRLSQRIEGLISNYQRVIDRYLRGDAPESLAKATAKLGGNFDTPIQDVI